MRALDGSEAGHPTGDADRVDRSGLMSGPETGGWILVVAGLLIVLWGVLPGLLWVATGP